MQGRSGGKECPIIINTNNYLPSINLSVQICGGVDQVPVVWDVHTHDISLDTSLYSKMIVHAHVPLFFPRQNEKNSETRNVLRNALRGGDTTGTTSVVILLLVWALRPLVALLEANRAIGSCLLPLAPPSSLQRTLEERRDFGAPLRGLWGTLELLSKTTGTALGSLSIPGMGLPVVERLPCKKYAIWPRGLANEDEISGKASLRPRRGGWKGGRRRGTCAARGRPRRCTTKSLIPRVLVRQHGVAMFLQIVYQVLFDAPRITLAALHDSVEHRRGL